MTLLQNSPESQKEKKKKGELQNLYVHIVLENPSYSKHQKIRSSRRHLTQRRKQNGKKEMEREKKGDRENSDK